MTARQPDRSSVPPIAGVVVGLAAASSASIMIRFAQREAPSLVIAAGRLAIASLILAPIAWTRYRDEYKKLAPGDGRLALLSGVFLALHFAAWISSLEYTSVASSTVLVSTSPLFVAVAAWLLLREKIGRAAVIGLTVALLGSAIIGISDAGATSAASAARNPLLGDLLAVAGAVAVAGYLLIGRRLRARLALVPYIAVVYSVAALVLTGMAAVARPSLAGYSPATYGWIIALALGPQLLGHSAFNWALAHLPATFVSIATLGEPIGSALLAYVIFGEAPTPVKIVGAALILVGIAVASKSDSQA